MRRLLHFAFVFLLALIFEGLAGIPARAAIAYDSNGSCASSNTTSCTPTSTTIGNIGIVLATRSGSTTAPTCPSGWTCPAGTPWTGSGGSGSTSISWAVGCKKFTTTNDSSGTWTNAGNVILQSYSGSNVGGVATCDLTIGGKTDTTAASATLTFGAITMSDAGGGSWVIGLAGSRTATNVNQAPAGMSSRKVSGTTDMVSGNDTNGGVSSWSSQSITVSTTTQNVGIVLELIALRCVNTSFGNGTTCVQQANTNNVGLGETSSASLAGVSASNVVVAISKYCNGSSCSSAVTATASIADTGTSICTASHNSPFTTSASGNDITYYLWLCTGLSAGSHTWTVTSTGTTSYYQSTFVSEWSGVGTAFDGTNGDAVGVGTGTTSTVTTSANDTNATDLIVGYTSLFSSAAVPGSGYTAIANNGTDGAEAKTVSATGSQTATWAMNPSSSQTWGAIIVPIKLASVATAPPPQMLTTGVGD